MRGIISRLAATAALGLVLAGCAGSGGYSESADSRSSSSAPRPSSVLQCVPYVRAHSNVTLYGDAYTWWDKAEGRYARSLAPSEGAVMVLHNYAGPQRGHVAVVRTVVDTREIRVDHANWLDDGAIYTDDPVRDVSANNDWSVVRVFNFRTGAWGSRNYPVQGFIGPGAPSSDVPVASARRPGDAIAALLAEDDDTGTN